VRRSIGRRPADEMRAVEYDDGCYDNRPQSLQQSSRVIKRGILRRPTPTHSMPQVAPPRRCKKTFFTFFYSRHVFTILTFFYFLQRFFYFKTLQNGIHVL